MKIPPKSVESYLAKPDRQHRAVLFYGPDSGLVRARAKAAAATVLSGSQNALALTELAEAKILDDPALLADELASIGLLASMRVILIGNASDKLSRIIAEASTYFHDAAFLIVCAGELSSRSALRLWFEKELACAAIACYHDEMRDVQHIVRQAFDTVGIRVDGNVMEYLSQQLGNDRGVTNQEISKLITYAGESRQLRIEDVQALIDYNRETGFDDVVNAVADRDVQALEKTLILMLREGMPPVAYLRALQRYFNRLYAIASQMASGQSAEDVVQSLKPPVFFKQAPILIRHAQSWNIGQIAKALRLLIAAELASKTSDLPPVPASTRRLLQVTQLR